MIEDLKLQKDISYGIFTQECKFLETYLYHTLEYNALLKVIWRSLKATPGQKEFSARCFTYTPR